ncbi:hypothetical protein [Botrimarina mediterranea]|uniref:Uncharacterized protein n=1 Tax=Botrimarina mediterranea TaxID=2528022 RepID=A0A518KB52_9BACT|nr:hypothetical protein [Botrimarina mediterranea]QDV75024.1 hypothetical protein Spa11_32330 [Botrimarina mediterranea]
MNTLCDFGKEPRIDTNLRESSFAQIRVYPRFLLIALSVVSLTGCGGSSSSGGKSSLDAMAEKLNQGAVQEKQAAKEKVAADAQATADAKAAEAERLATQGGTEVTTDDMQRGSKMTRGGYLQTTLKGGIRAEQKLNLYTVQHAMNLYYGEHGNYPKSHEEFMEKIIDYNGIVLEPLQEPYEYYYNAEDGELYKVAKQEAVEAAQAEAAAAQAEADRKAEAAKQ